MDRFNIQDAKAKFSKLMRRVEQGQSILIEREGVVVARITPEILPRGIKLGRDAGKGSIAANFDAPLKEFVEYEE
jgi:prevent-host-death family protein